jgi:hypothetical protein
MLEERALGRDQPDAELIGFVCHGLLSVARLQITDGRLQLKPEGGGLSSVTCHL